jgi:hypothetical protein
VHGVHDGCRLHLLRDDEQYAGMLRLLLGGSRIRENSEGLKRVPLAS